MARKRKAAPRPRKQEDDAKDANPSSLDDMSDGHGAEGQTGSKEGDSNDAALSPHDVEHFDFPHNDKSIICERRGESGKPSLIWTHGAGGGLEAPATKDFADGFAEKASIVSFKGAMNLQSRVKSFNAVIEHEDFDSALGGRSMGARAACIAATHEDRQTKALVLVSFPLIGATKKDSREQVLLDLPENIDVLFISGDRDSMCDTGQLATVTQKMQSRTWLVVVEGANHGMDWKPKDAALEMRRMTGAIAAEWLETRDQSKRHYSISWNGDVGKISCKGWKEVEKSVAEKEVDEEVADATEEKSPPAKKRRSKR